MSRATLNVQSVFKKGFFSRPDNYDFSWNLFYGQLTTFVNDHYATVDFQDFIKKQSTFHTAIETGYSGHSAIDLAHALLHATCTEKDKWKDISNRWQVVELLINSGAPFTATSGAIFKEYAIDRMIAGHAPVDLIVLALKKGAWIGRGKDLLQTIEKDYDKTRSTALKNALSIAVHEIAEQALRSAFNEQSRSHDKRIKTITDDVIAHVKSMVTHYFGNHTDHDLIGVETLRVITHFSQRYVADFDKAVNAVVSSIRFDTPIDVAKLQSDFATANGEAETFSAEATLFAKRKLLRQIALRFVDEKMGALREKTPSVDLDVIINDLLNLFKPVIGYDTLERCIQLDVDQTLRERATNTFNAEKAVASVKTLVGPESARPVGFFDRFSLFGQSCAAPAALAAPPAQPDNRTVARR